MPETITMLTDYALAVVTAALGAVLLARSHGDVPARLWGQAFLALATAGVLGGTWHGFHASIPPAPLAWLWRFNEWAIGLFGLLAIAATTFAAFTGRLRRALLAIAAAGYVVFVVLSYGDDRFFLVLIQSIAVMVYVLFLHGTALRPNPASPWIVAGIAVSAVAALTQTSAIVLGPLDHNDLFHIVQLGAMLLLFQGARRIGPARA